MKLTFSPTELAQKCKSRLESTRAWLARLEEKKAREIETIRATRMKSCGFLGLKTRPLTQKEAESIWWDGQEYGLSEICWRMDFATESIAKLELMLGAFESQGHMVTIDHNEWDFLFNGTASLRWLRES